MATTTNLGQLLYGDLTLLPGNDTTSSGYGNLAVAGTAYIGGASATIAGTTTLGSTLTVAGASTFNNSVTITPTTDATSTTTGVLQVKGGVGIAKALYTGNAAILPVGNSYYLINNALAASPATNYALWQNNLGDLILNAASTRSLGLSINAVKYAQLNSDGTFSILNTTDASSTTTGSLNVAGGAGFAKSVYVGNTLNINSAADYPFMISSTSTSKTLHAAGIYKSNMGQGDNLLMMFGQSNTVANSAYMGFVFDAAGSSSNMIRFGMWGGPDPLYLYADGHVSAPSTIDSTSTTSGALQVSGGAGIAKNLSVGGSLFLTSTVDSTSTTSGAVQIAGGLGVAKSIYAASITLNTTSTASVTPLRTFAPSLAANSFVSAQLGVASTANNCAQIVFNYSTADSTANSVGFCLSGASQALTIDGNSIVRVPTTADATSTTSGALQVAGGVGIAKSLNVGGFQSFGKTNAGAPTFTTHSAGTKIVLWDAIGATTTDFAIGVNSDTMWFSISENLAARSYKWYGGITNIMTLDGTGTLSLLGTADSTSTTSGVLQVAGGAGIAKNLSVGGSLFLTSTVDATSTTSGAVQIAGGAGIAKSLYVGGIQSFGTVGSAAPSFTTRSAGTKVVLYDALAATSADYAMGIEPYTFWSSVPQNISALSFKWYGGTTGLMTLNGSGMLSLLSTADSTSTTSGSLQVAGGMGISKSITMGHNGGSQLNLLKADGTSGGTIAMSAANAGRMLITSANDMTLGTGTNAYLYLMCGSSGVANIRSSLTSWLSIFAVTNTTDTTSTTTGALQVAGGVAIAKNLMIGGQFLPVHANGMIISYDQWNNFRFNATATLTSAWQIASGTGVNLFKFGHDGTFTVTSTTDATSSSTSSGTVQIYGGLGVAMHGRFGSGVWTNMTAFSAATTPGQFLNVGGATFTDNSTAASGTVAYWSSARMQAGTVAATNTGITYSAASTLRISGPPVAGTNVTITNAYALDVVSGIARIGDTTNSTNSSTGALVVAGGLGVAGDSNFGGNLYVTGAISSGSGTIDFNSTVDSTTPSNGAVRIVGGLGVGKHLNVGYGLGINQSAYSYAPRLGQFLLVGTGTAASTFTDNATAASGTVADWSGSLVNSATVAATNTGVTYTRAASFYVAGAPIAGTNVTMTNAYAMYVAAGRTLLADTTASTSATSGALIVSGGTGIAGNLNVGGNLALSGNVSSVTGTVNFANTTVSTSATSGALIVSGGTGISGNLNVGGDFAVSGNITGITGTVALTNTTDSSSTTSGAFQVAGGAGIAKTLSLGGLLNMTNTGAAPPTFTTRSVGTRIVLSSTLSATATDYAFGMDASALWYSVPTAASTNSFAWYGGTTQVMTLDGLGNMVLAGTADATATNTGALQVAGGASFGKSIWIGDRCNVVGTNFTLGSGSNATSDTGYSRALVKTGTTLVINYAADFVGVRIDSNVAMKNSSINFANGAGNTYGLTWGLPITSQIYENVDLHVWTDNNMYFDVGGTVSTATNVMKLTATAVTVNTASSFGGNITMTGTNPLFTFNNSAGLALPTFTTRSTGTRVLLYSALGATSADWAVGISSDTLWHSVPTAIDTSYFRWYGGTTQAMQLSGAGNLRLLGTQLIQSTVDSTSTGTGALQVAGGAGVTGNLSIGNAFWVGANSSSWNLTYGKGLYMRYSTQGGQDSAYIQSITRATAVYSPMSFNASNLTFWTGVSDAAGLVSRMNIDVNGIVSVTLTTDATNATDGAFQTVGGISVGKNIFVANAVRIPDTKYVHFGYGVAGKELNAGKIGYQIATAGSLDVFGAGTTAGSRSIMLWDNVTVNNGLLISGTTPSTSPTTGALTLVGGLGVGNNVYVGGVLDVANAGTIRGAFTALSTGSFAGALSVNIATNSTSPATGAIVTTGGLGVALNTYLGGTLNVTGASVFAGTVSMAGISNVTNSTDSTAPNNGAFIVQGGVGVGLNLNVGGNLGVNGNTVIAGNLTVRGVRTEIAVQSLSINDAMIVVNAAPGGTSDSGYAMKRWQYANDGGLGDIVNNDVADFSGTATAGTATTITLPATASTVDGYYNGAWIRLTSGTGSGQVRRIRSYNGTTKVATIYSTADQATITPTLDPVEGMDFTTPPGADSGYQIFYGQYVLTYYDEQYKEYTMGYTPINPTGNSAQPVTGAIDVFKRLNVHAGSLRLDKDLKVDTINEFTTGAGVTVGGVLMKGGVVTGVTTMNGTQVDYYGTVTLTDTKTDSVNIPGTTTGGAYIVMVQDQIASGTSAIFMISGSSTRGGTVNRLVSTLGSKMDHLTIVWDQGTVPRLTWLANPSTATPLTTFRVKVVRL